MFLQRLLTTGLMVTTAVGASLNRKIVHSDGFGCDVQGTDAHKAMHALFAGQESLDRRMGRLGQRNMQTVLVDAYMHIITASANDTTTTNISDDVVSKQLAVMNEGYAGTGFTFTLKGVDRTANSTWASSTGLDDMRRKLRKGDYAALNLYFIPQMTVFGFCTLPENVTSGDTTFLQDGCTIRSDTVPGGAATNFNLGKTVVHEVGHWFGLLHTFEGGCNGDGDMISDTPAQQSATYGCPVGRDSCPGEQGLDPIHNYMDYSFDSCYEEFTNGQIDRMRSFWNTYRG